MTYEERQAKWQELLAQVPEHGPYRHAVGDSRITYLANRMGLKNQTLRKWQCNTSQGIVRYPPPSEGLLNLHEFFAGHVGRREVDSLNHKHSFNAEQSVTFYIIDREMRKAE